MILDKFSLKEKVAIVTGANTGLGLGMCVALAEAGALIAGVSRSCADETKSLVQRAGSTFFEIKADLMTADPKEIIDEAVKHYGRIDILVNNAGIIKRQDALDFSQKNWDDVLNINLKAVFFLSQAAANPFISQKTKGKIINIASMLSYQGGIRVPSYTASKSAVLGLTKSLANEWAKHGINVNAIAPGYMITNNTENLRKDPKRLSEITNRIPAGRWGTPEDLGGAVVFLASEASDYVNGFTIAVDGGYLAR